MQNGPTHSENDLQSYKFGRICGWVIFTMGATILVAGMAYVARTGTGTELATAYSVLAVPGVGLMLLLTGLGLAFRRRIGLWLLYFLTAVWLYGFGSTTYHRLISGSRDDIYGIIWSALWMIAWLYAAGYFYRRRNQFTRSWREPVQKIRQCPKHEQH